MRIGLQVGHEYLGARMRRRITEQQSRPTRPQSKVVDRESQRVLGFWSWLAAVTCSQQRHGRKLIFMSGLSHWVDDGRMRTEARGDGPPSVGVRSDWIERIESVLRFSIRYTLRFVIQNANTWRWTEPLRCRKCRRDLHLAHHSTLSPAACTAITPSH
jgi:hypothetical protein